MPAGQLFWPDDMTEKLKLLWATGLSCRGIADDLGVSRNAVIGKVHRLGLEPRARVIPNNKGKKRKPKLSRSRLARRDVFGRLIVVETYEQRSADVEPLNIPLLDLADGSCRYPSDAAPITFCGHPKQAGSSYCPAHHEICWRPRGAVSREEFHQARIERFRAYKAELVA